MLCFCLVGCGKEIPVADLNNSYAYNNNVEPTFKSKHIKWVGVPGGQISVDDKDLILEFVGYGGKRYLY